MGYYFLYRVYNERSGKKKIYQKEQESCQEGTENSSIENCAQTAVKKNEK